MSGVEVYKDKIIRINVIGERTEHPLHDIVHAIWEPILYWDEDKKMIVRDWLSD